jgi:hypothetical protein
VAALPENDLANHRPPMPSLITTLGGIIAAVCSRCQSQRNYEFAMDQIKTLRQTILNLAVRGKLVPHPDPELENSIGHKRTTITSQNARVVNHHSDG